MGFIDKLFGGRKKESALLENEAQESMCVTENDAVSAWDFKYSQSIYRRNLMGVLIYEVEAAAPAGGAKRKELFLGEYIEMADGRLTLGVRAEGGVSIFGCGSGLSLSYSSHGESFFVEAKVVNATAAAAANEAMNAGSLNDENADGKAGTDISNAGLENYIVEIMLCSEPVRHRRRYGRVATECNVYYKVKPGGQDSAAGDEVDYNVTKTIDISEGGFKSIVENQLPKNTEIECVVEIDNHSKSKGKLIGRVLRCDHMVGSIEMFEMTVQFVELDDSVKGFLVGWIEKKHPGAVDAEAKITISADGLEALIELSTPRNGGSDLTYEALCARLSSEGIKFGVDNEALKALSEKPYYNLESVIAHGTPPVHGGDAVLAYNVEMNPLFKPKEKEAGTVDFKDIGLIQKVSKDDVLVEKTLLSEGANGISVTGEVIESKPGGDKKLPVGENTAINEAGTALLSCIDGCLSIVNDRINVFNMYVVEGDVQYETGNISHNGVVVVKGDVRKGFAVDASGDIIVHGTVESAAVTAGGSLVVRGGCVGEENAIEADGDVAVKFINGGVFNIRGSLKTEYIINSTIKCGGSIGLVGGGIIRNSYVVAKSSIRAKIIGSVHGAADKTVVEVGNDPELLNRFVVVSKKLDQLEKDIEAFETSIRTLTIRKYKNELSADKLRVLDKSNLLVKQFSMQHEELAYECNSLKEQIDKLGFGAIYVHDTAFEGMRIIIGPCTLVLRDSVKAVKFFRSDDRISFTSC